MRTFIIYASKHGFTEECMEYIKRRVNSEVTVINVQKNQDIDLYDADWVILGGSVYMGKMNKSLRRFTEKNRNILLTKNLALFVCCMTPSESANYLKECFSEQLYSKSEFKANFGGKLNTEKLNFFERTLTKMVAQQDDKKEEILSHHMDELIHLVNSRS